MSKLVLAAVAGGAVIGAMIAASRQRPSQTAGVIPVDDEINLEPFERRKGSKVVVKEERSLRTTQLQPSGKAVVIEDLNADPKLRKILEHARAEHDRASVERSKAEEVAAKAAAAVAAATALRDRESMDAEQRERVEKLVKDLEEAESQKRKEAWELKKLLVKGHKYLRQAEKEAEELLKEQERLMLEAARHEQHSRELEAQIEAERARLAQQRAEEAERRARALEAAHVTELERIRAEQAAAENTRRALLEEEANARQREAVVGRLATEREVAERKARQAEEAMLQAQRLLQEAERQRSIADREIRSNAPGDVDARLRGLQQELEMHQRRAEEAKQVLSRVDKDRDVALAERQQAVGVASRFRSWLAGSTSEKPTVVAVADSKGRAVANEAIDERKEKGTSRSVRVDATGSASVGFEERPAHAGTPVEGRWVDARRGPGFNEAESSVQVREGSRVLK